MVAHKSAVDKSKWYHGNKKVAVLSNHTSIHSKQTESVKLKIKISMMKQNNLLGE